MREDCDKCVKYGVRFICRVCSRSYRDQFQERISTNKDALPETATPVTAKIKTLKTGREFWIERAIYIRKNQIEVIQTEYNRNYTEKGQNDGLYYYREGWYSPVPSGDDIIYLPISEEVIEWKEIK